MTLDQQYEKATSKKSIIEVDVAGVLIDVTSEDYTIWLEEKLTWKKFSEKKPDVGSNVIINHGGFFIVKESIQELNFSYYLGSPLKSEWIYVPD